MKAVNLIPKDLRGGGAAPTRTGSAVYVVLGALGVLVVLVAAWALVGRQVSNRETDLARVTAEAGHAEAQANRLAPYAEFAELRTKRVETVRSLARSRFNWSFALREVSRVVPENVTMTSLIGTVSPDVTVQGGTGGSALRANLRSPAIELSGCSTSHSEVAEFVTRLREIEGVTRVTLTASEKTQAAKGATAGAGSGGGASDCRQGNPKFPQFQIVAWFERSQAGADGASASAGQATPTASTTPAQGATK